MSSNPYEAPKAPVADYVPSEDQDGFRPEPKVCAAGAGARWLSEGWAAFTHSPGPWLLITLIWFLIAFVLYIVPGGSLAQNLLFPVMMAGIMLGCDAMRRGEPLRIEHLFAGFSAPNVGQLVLVGAIYLGAVFAVALVVMVPVIALGGFALFRSMASGTQPDLSMMLPLLLGMLVFMALLVPLLMALWFAPPLVVFQKMPAIDAMKLSFAACLKNFMPFLVYGLIGILIAFAASIPLFLGWFVASPIFFGSTYASYREIFHTD